jgi:hypothetical protein
MGQRVELSLRPTWIGNICQQAQQRRECDHGNLRFGCRPKSQTSSGSGIPLFISTSLRPTGVAIRTQVKRSGSVEQPWNLSQILEGLLNKITVSGDGAVDPESRSFIAHAPEVRFYAR